jgi:cob(I)alamin adenosyltransferase
MALKIYTKTGDKGKTSLIGGTKVPKSNIRIEAYGSVDELNSFLGLLRDQVGIAYDTTILKEVQDRLFTIGSSLACDPVKESSLLIPDLKETDVDLLEKEIDRMNEELPEMKHFVLPGGHVTVSTAHVVRCVCRRAERICVLLNENNGHVEPLVLKYLNRLSDFFFVLSRHLSKELNVVEIPWQPRI